MYKQEPNLLGPSKHGDSGHEDEIRNEVIDKSVDYIAEKSGWVLAKAASAVLGFLLDCGTLNGGSDHPLEWDYWFVCAYCEKKCQGQTPCTTYSRWKRRTSARIRDSIREQYPKFFGWNGMEAVDISFEDIPSGWVTDPKSGLRLFRDAGVIISVNADTPELSHGGVVDCPAVSIHESARLGGSLRLNGPGGSIVARLVP